jgi:hypothetical protein
LLLQSTLLQRNATQRNPTNRLKDKRYALYTKNLHIQDYRDGKTRRTAGAAFDKFNVAYKKEGHKRTLARSNNKIK